MRSLPLCLGILLAASASPLLARQSMQERGAAELAKEIQGLVPGKPVNCLSLSRITNSNIIDGTAIVYRALGGTVYVNRTRGPELLREDNIPVQFVYGSELCRLDRIKLLDRMTRGDRGSIGLAEFVPYTKPGKH